MSDVGLGATLQLDIADALSKIDQLTSQLNEATTGIQVTLEAPDASPVTAAIDDAIEAADTTVEADADAAEVTSAIDEAIDAAETTVPVDADTAEAQGQIDSLEGDPVNIPVDADTAEADAAISDTIQSAEGEEIELTVTAETGDADSAIAAVGDAASGASQGVDDLSASTAALGEQTSTATGETAGLTNGIAALANVNTATTGSARGLGSALSAISPGTQTAVAGVAALVGVVGGFANAAIDAQVSADRFTTTTGRFASEIRNVDVGDLDGDLADLAATLGTSDEALQDAGSNIFQLGVASGAASPQVAQTTEEILALSLRARALNPALGESGDIADRMAQAFARGGRALTPFGISLTSAEIAARALADTGKTSADQLTQYEKAAAGAALATEKFGGSLQDAIDQGAENPTIRLAALKNSFGELSEELGKPLVIPVIDALEALAPLGLAATTVLGAMAQALIPLFEAFSALAAPIQGFANLIALIPQPVFALATGLGLLAFGLSSASAAFVAMSVASGGVLPVLAGIGIAIAGLVTVFGAFGSSEDKFQGHVDDATEALKDQDGQLSTSTQSIANYIETVSRFEARNQIDDIARLGLSAEQTGDLLRKGGEGFREFEDRAIASGEVTEVFRDELGRLVDATGKVIGSAGGMDSALGRVTDVNGRLLVGNTDLVKSFEKEQKILQEAAKGALEFEVKQGDVADSFLETAEASGDYVTALEAGRQAADDAAASALAVALANGTLSRAEYDTAIAATTAAGGLTDYSAALGFVQEQGTRSIEAQRQLAAGFAETADRLPVLVTHLAHLADGVGNTDADLLTLATDLQGATVTAIDFDRAAAAMGVTTEQLQEFVQGASDALAAFVDTGVGKLPSIGSAFDAARDHAKEAERALSGKDIAAALNETVESIRGYSANLTAILGSAYSDLAGFAVQQGPDAVAAIAASLKDNDGKTLDSIRTNLTTAIPTALGEATTLITQSGQSFVVASGELGALAADTLGLNFIPNEQVAQQLLSAAGAVPVAGTPLVTAFGVLGAATVAQYLASFNITDPTQAQIDQAVADLNAAGIPIGSAGAALGTAAKTGYEDTWSTLPAVTQATLNANKASIDGAAPGAKSSGQALGTAGATGYEDTWSGLPAITAKGVAGAKAAIDSGKPGVVASGKATGTETSTAWNTGLVSGLNSGATAANNAAKAQVAGAKVVAVAQANIDGQGVGQSFGQGIVSGINSYVGKIASAAASAVRAAEAAARREAQSQSPSKLFARLGRDLGAGVELGIEDSTSGIVAAAEEIVREAAAATAAGSLGIPEVAQLSAAVAASTQAAVAVGQSVGPESLAGTGGAAGSVTVTVHGMQVTLEFPDVTTAEQARDVAPAAADAFIARLLQQDIMLSGLVPATVR